jgi:hypothetical protein
MLMLLKCLLVRNTHASSTCYDYTFTSSAASLCVYCTSCLLFEQLALVVQAERLLQIQICSLETGDLISVREAVDSIAKSHWYTRSLC